MNWKWCMEVNDDKISLHSDNTKFESIIDDESL